MSEEIETVTLEDLQAKLASQETEFNTELERMRNHMDKLLTETKQAKDEKKKALDDAKREADEKARKEQDFEQLHKSSEAERAKLEEQLKTLQGNIAREKKSAEAMRLASKLAEGDNASLLSTFIEQRLKYEDDQIHVTNEAGELTVSTLDDLEKDFQQDTRFAALLKGNQASGGGATGGKNGSSAAKTMTRAEFDSAPQADRAKFFASGGTLTD